MILDKYIPFTYKVILAVICSGLWIYFRTAQSYDMIPRNHLFPVVFVMIWYVFELLRTAVFTYRFDGPGLVS